MDVMTNMWIDHLEELTGILDPEDFDDLRSQWDTIDDVPLNFRDDFVDGTKRLYEAGQTPEQAHDVLVEKGIIPPEPT